MELKSGKLLGIACVVLLLIFGAFIVGSRTSDTSAPIDSAPIPPSAADFQGREQALLGLIAQNPQDAELPARLGDLYFESRSFLQAIEQYERAIELDPRDADSYNDLGLVYHYTGRTGDAIKTLRKGTEADPNYQRVWLSLGYILAASGNTPEAIETLEKTISFDPDNDLSQEARKIMASIRR